MPFGDKQLEHMIAAGACDHRSVRVWARSAVRGTHRIRLRRQVVGAAKLSREDLREIEVALDPAVRDGTGAWSFGAEPSVEPLRPNTRYTLELRHGAVCLATAAFRTAVVPGASPQTRRWSFGALSCHQPFGDDGEVTDDAISMLSAVMAAYVDADVRFILLMGDQTYSDMPADKSLFNAEHFAQVAPPGRAQLLDCSADEIRALYQRRHRIFWACEPFVRLQSAFACYPMLDDHEIIDNFGSDPAHVGPQWEALRRGALDAFFDYQGARVLPRTADGLRPRTLDWGFRFGPAAVWGMDTRSLRRTVDDVTTVYGEQQFAALKRFIAAQADAKLLVLMSPIPLVHVEGKVVELAGAVLGKGSDLHERWAHPQCRHDRDQLLSILRAHARRHPRQRIIVVSGDVHAGAAFQIDFEDGAQLIQMTSSAVSNSESWWVAKACEIAAHTVDIVELADGSRGRVSLIRGESDEAASNPYGGLNAGIVDVYDHGDTVAVGFRLVGHDGRGGAITVFDTGQIGWRRDPQRRHTGIDDALRDD